MYYATHCYAALEKFGKELNKNVFIGKNIEHLNVFKIKMIY